MCDKCDDIDKTILRYRRIKERVTDQAFFDGAQKLIDELEADKAALHNEGDEGTVVLPGGSGK